MPVTHPSELWDFDDPQASERRFREAAEASSGADSGIWLTQVARALGLQERYDEAHAVLDGAAAGDVRAPEVDVRVLLERGRLLRSSGSPATALPLLEQAAARAGAAGLEELHIDARHMAALAAPAGEQLPRNYAALATCRASADPAARRWAASLLNNIGMACAEAADWGDALAAFEDALAEREAHGTPGQIRVARWMVAWTLRNLGDRGPALRIQRQLKAELLAAGEEDPYVDEELAILDG